MNSDLFLSCQRDSLSESYQCCLQKCGEANICRALCRNVYAGTIPEDCSAQVGCRHPNWVDSSCLKEQQHAFKACCLHRCRRHQWSDAPAIARLFRSIPNVDCVEYCNNAEMILLDQRDFANQND